MEKANERLEKANERLEKANENLKTDIAQVKQSHQRLEKENEDLKADITRMQKSHERLEAQNEKQEKEIHGLVRDLRKEREVQDEISEGLRQVRWPSCSLDNTVTENTGVPSLPF